ncbi:MAG: enoyl-CoA hydratase-related protein [Pseudomonadota bacterium]
MWNVDDQDFVRTLTLSRPDAMNALSPQAIDELIELLEAAGGDNGVRVLVLTAEGKLFSSGMDVGALKTPNAQEHVRMFNYAVPKMFNTFIDFPKPIVMGVNGTGVGWGATVLSHADVAIMAESARLRCPFTALGNVPEACSTAALPRLIGHQQAFWLLTSGDWYTAEQCREIGLVLDVVPDAKLAEETQRRAKILAAYPRDALIESKRLINGPYREAMRKANREEMDTFVDMLDNPACKEGLSAFLEKRPADFSAY